MVLATMVQAASSPASTEGVNPGATVAPPDTKRSPVTDSQALAALQKADTQALDAFWALQDPGQVFQPWEVRNAEK